jgi:hypothetical protein
MNNVSLLVTANVVPSSLILFTLMVEATRPSETSVPIRTTRHHIAEDGILNNRNSVALSPRANYTD